MGDLWWSITEEFAHVLVKAGEELMPYWEDCYVSDETFAQTVLMNLADCQAQRSHWETRLIDWGRGNPYVWQEKDIDEIMQSKALFVRKIDPADSRLADRIYATLIKRKNGLH